MKKHVFLTLAALFSFCMGAWADDWGDGVCGLQDGILNSNLEWKFSDNTGTLTIKGSGAMYNYESGGAPWYKYREDVQKVVIYNTVTTIGNLAFEGCSNMTTVEFYDTSTSSSLQTIGQGAFYNCNALGSLDFSKTKLTSLGYVAFSNCTSLTSITLPTTLQTIGQSAFIGCTNLASTNLSSLSKLTTIGNNAFYDCPLTTINIPAKVTSIGTSAFSPYNLTNISVNSSNTVYEATNNCLIKKPEYENTMATLVIGSNQQSVTIPDGVSVGESAFAGCKKIESLTFEGTYSIHRNAFSNCTNLKTITINSCAPRSFDKSYTFNGLTTKNIKLYVPAEYVDDYVNSSYGWNIFDIYVIPGQSAKFNLVFKADGKTVSTVPVEYRQEISESNYPVAPEKVGHTFSQWTGVPTTMPAKDVEVTAKYTVNSYTITYMVDDEQYDVQTYEYGATVTSPATPTKAQHKFSGWNPSIPPTMPAENLTITGSFIPLGGDGIEWSLSEGNSGALAITGSGAMYNYTSDSYVPWLQAAIGDGMGGYAISKITIAEGITTIGDYAFFKCNSNALTTVTLPNALVAIGKAAFAHCSGLTSIVIPAKVATIGADAFRRCTNLSSVTCLATTPPQLKRENGDEGVFAQIAKGAKLYVPASSLAAYAKSSWSDYFDICVKEGDTTPTFTITFDTDGGSAVAPITQEYKTAVTAPADPTKEGYTFAGWDMTIPSTMPAGNMTIKAKWTAKTYTITFDTKGGSTVAPITQEYNTAVTAPAAPTKTGYTFDGWDKNIPSTMPAENVTITAKWKVNQYTIQFNSNGGSTVSSITQDYGTKITAPTNPTKEGYTFKGWNPALPATMPAETKTHTAQWTINQYTITFNTDGGSEIAAITQDYNTTVTAPANPTKTGYTFARWDIEIPANMPARDMTIKALWTIGQYSITFDTDGGTNVNPIVQDYGTAVTAPTTPTKEGYTFAGWNPEVPETMPEGDLAVKAQWTVNQYTITFDVDGGTAVDPITQDYNTAVTAPADPTKDGYTFNGWDPEIPPTMPANNVTINANWTVNSYKVTYMVDGEQYGEKQTYEYGAAITAIEAPTKEGYTFSGWSEIPANMPAKDVTIEGSFTVNTYTLIYKVDGKEHNTITVQYGATITAIEAPTKEGYTFSGWSEIPATMPASDVEITGTFTINQYKITFKHGDVVIADYTQDYGTTITAPEPPAKNGYTFDRWDGLCKTVPAHDVEITAVYKENIMDIVDGDTEEFIHEEDILYKRITYTRTFSNTNWQALYVPFEIELTEEFLADFEVAYIYNTRQYDRDEDGFKDETIIESFKKTNGVLEANYPYLIRAKEVGEKTITVTDAILYAAEENFIDCSSVFDTYTFTGTYSRLSSQKLPQGEGYYALSDGVWQPIAEGTSLSAFRFYLKVDSRSGVNAAQGNAIRMRVIDENGNEDDTTRIDHSVLKTEHPENVIYDLQGRRVLNPTKGMYIVNGKKTFIK